ncbi:MAG: hypothetical protein KGJ57_19440 [Sphingomonadales bacterium]|nr:hypothetical protein [Sphingomonadales bacterium]MDE2171568.1 hypothetical protein [Sphingomonadales bacterium]
MRNALTTYRYKGHTPENWLKAGRIKSIGKFDPSDGGKGGLIDSGSRSILIRKKPGFREGSSTVAPAPFKLAILRVGRIARVSKARSPALWRPMKILTGAESWARQSQLGCTRQTVDRIQAVEAARDRRMVIFGIGWGAATQFCVSNMNRTRRNLVSPDWLAGRLVRVT